jgi:uncharacterized repeat protein (TIGR01451 family)
MINRLSKRNGIIIAVVCLLTALLAGSSFAKSMYVIANHHTGQFDAYNIAPPGSVPPIAYQARYNLTHAGDPGDVAVWIDPTTNPPEGALFITSEFDYGVELVDAKTMTSLGWVTGGYGLAGIDVDDVNNLVYTVDRASGNLYVYDWNPTAKTLTLRAGFPRALPGLSSAFGIALDEFTDRLYVADAGSWTPATGYVRVYDVNTFTELFHYQPSIPPVGIAIDRYRGYVYTSAPDGYCASAPTGYTLLSKYDLNTSTESVVNMGHGGMGIAVDEATGLVYVTGGCYGDDISIWDSNLNFQYSTGSLGTPAGIEIANVSYNPLNLAKNDMVQGYGLYVGQTFPYLITYANSNSYDITGVILHDDLPLEIDFISETVGGVPGTGVYDPNTHSVTWNIGNLAAGQAGPDIQLVVRVNGNAVPGSTILNYCTIESDQTPPTTVIGDDPDNPNPNEPGNIIIEGAPVAVDIKPGSCPNKLYIYSVAATDNSGSQSAASKAQPDASGGDRWVPSTAIVDLVVSIIGGPGFNVYDIDLATVRMNDIPWLKYRFKDISTPVADGSQECVCHEYLPDGYVDLILKFDQNALAAGLGEIIPGQAIPVTFTGNMKDGSPFSATDCVIFIVKPAPVKFLPGVDDDGGYKWEDDIEAAQTLMPTAFALYPNRPNPFNPYTEISFSLPVASDISLDVYNILGQQITTVYQGYLEAGNHSFYWNGSSVSSGIYLYRLKAGAYTQTMKMMLLK